MIKIAYQDIVSNKINLDFMKRINFYELYFHYYLFKELVLSFGILNSFWDFPLFGLGGSSGSPHKREGEISPSSYPPWEKEETV